MANKHERTMDSFLKKWLGAIAAFLTVAFLSSIGTFIQMGSAVAQNTIDIKEVKQTTKKVTELRIRQENLIGDVRELANSVKDNRKIMLEILREVKK